MSGIYIPDVSLPKEGDFELWISVRKDGSFTYNVKGGWQNGKKKAISVPLHGRSIDADALIRELEITEEDDRNGATLLMAVFLEVLKAAPTIIPADRPNAEIGVQQEYLQNWHEEGE